MSLVYVGNRFLKLMKILILALFDGSNLSDSYSRERSAEIRAAYLCALSLNIKNSYDIIPLYNKIK